MQILAKRIRPLEISQQGLTIWLSLLICLLQPAEARSEDILAQHRIDALKALSEIIVLRPNAQSEMLPLRELGDFLEVTVRRRLPELKIRLDSASDWFELRSNRLVRGPWSSEWQTCRHRPRRAGGGELAENGSAIRDSVGLNADSTRGAPNPF